MLTPGPQGLGWIPPVGSEACAHRGGLRAAFWGGGGPSSSPAKAGPLEDASGSTFGLLGRSGAFEALGLVSNGNLGKDRTPSRVCWG